MGTAHPQEGDTSDLTGMFAEQGKQVAITLGQLLLHRVGQAAGVGIVEMLFHQILTGTIPATDLVGMQGCTHVKMLPEGVF
jgi:hypothetical protein